MPSTSISQHERHGVWVPASAGTTPMLSPPAALFQHSPRRCMVAGAFLRSYAAIDAGLDQTRRDCRAEEKMIEPQACIARPPVSLVIPESKHRFGRMKGAQRVAPALRDQRFERGAGFRLYQRVLVPRS